MAPVATPGPVTVPVLASQVRALGVKAPMAPVATPGPVTVPVLASQVRALLVKAPMAPARVVKPPIRSPLTTLPATKARKTNQGSARET